MTAHTMKKRTRPRQVRKTLTIEAGKLELAREILGVHNDAEVLRLALDHLLNHFTGRLEEKE